MQLGTIFLTPSVPGGGSESLVEQGEAVLIALGSPSVIFDGDEALTILNQNWIVGLLCTSIETVKALSVTECDLLSVAGFPGVTTFNISNGGDIDLSGNILSIIEVSLLEEIISISLFLDNNDFGEINFPALLTLTNAIIHFQNNPNLISVSFDSLNFLSGTCTFNFSGCALPTAMIDAICTSLADGYQFGTTGTIDFTGAGNGKPSIIIASLVVNTPGILYSIGQEIVAVGTGTGFSAQVDNVDEFTGAIISAAITNAGSGYISDVTFEIPSVLGTGGQISATTSDNEAIANLKAGGSGFTITTN